MKPFTRSDSIIRLKLNIFLLFFPVVLRAILQQPELHYRMQEQWGMCHQQKEQNRLQSMSTPQVPDGRDVQVRLKIRQTLQLVQNPLPPPRTTASSSVQVSTESTAIPSSLSTAFSSASLPWTSAAKNERGTSAFRPR